MTRTALAVVVLAGCGDGVHSAPDAPFALEGVRSALWTVGAEEVENYQTAMLVLTSEALACDDLAGLPYAQLLARAAESGTGVLVVLDQWSAPDAAPPDWTGAWVSESTFADEYGGDLSGGRSVGLAGFSDGVLVENWEDPTWARLDRVDDEKVAGEFDGAWWWGSFRAEPCAAWDAATTTSYTPYSSY